jgi:hypothetical protein
VCIVRQNVGALGHVLQRIDNVLTGLIVRFRMDSFIDLQSLPKIGGGIS